MDWSTRHRTRSVAAADCRHQDEWERAIRSVLDVLVNAEDFLGQGLAEAGLAHPLDRFFAVDACPLSAATEPPRRTVVVDVVMLVLGMEQLRLCAVVSSWTT